MKRNLSVAASIVLAFFLGMALGHYVSKKAAGKTMSTPPAPIDRKLAFAEDGRRIHRNKLYLNATYHCQMNWLAAHPHSTLPANSVEACTNIDEILTEWNEANEANQ